MGKQCKTQIIKLDSRYGTSIPLDLHVSPRASSSQSSHECHWLWCLQAPGRWHYSPLPKISKPPCSSPPGNKSCWIIFKDYSYGLGVQTIMTLTSGLYRAWPAKRFFLRLQDLATCNGRGGGSRNLGKSFLQRSVHQPWRIHSIWQSWGRTQNQCQPTSATPRKLWEMTCPARGRRSRCSHTYSWGRDGKRAWKGWMLSKSCAQ